MDVGWVLGNVVAVAVADAVAGAEDDETEEEEGEGTSHIMGILLKKPSFTRFTRTASTCLRVWLRTVCTA